MLFKCMLIGHLGSDIKADDVGNVVCLLPFMA